jgi:hypothetical protein
MCPWSFSRENDTETRQLMS